MCRRWWVMRSDQKESCWRSKRFLFRSSGDDRRHWGSDKSGTSFVVPLIRSLPRVSPFGLLLRRSLSRPPGLRVSKTLRVTVPRQQPDQAQPQAKPLDFIGAPDLGETGEMRRRCAQRLGVRSEARSSALPERWTCNGPVLADRAMRGSGWRSRGRRAWGSAVHGHRRRIHPALHEADELHRALLSKPAKPKFSTASAWAC